MDQHPDNKAYKIQNPQAPLVQTRRHAEFQMDDYPQGTNAVVAVISYTVRVGRGPNQKQRC
jgi:DNA-directed RNA polymerase I subunit RPA2